MRFCVNPVEDGSVMNDHIENDPERVSIQYLISNSPILITPLGSDGVDRVQNAIDTLMEIRDNKSMLTVVSGLKVYEDMVVRNIDIPIRRNLGQALYVGIGFRKITKVTSDEVIISANTSSLQAMPTQNVGSQTPTTIQ